MLRYFLLLTLFLLSINPNLRAQTTAMVTTVDIDRYWEAFDSLALAGSTADSVAVFQRLYLDRLTPGGRDFAKAREWTAKR